MKKAMCVALSIVNVMMLFASCGVSESSEKSSESRLSVAVETEKNDTVEGKTEGENSVQVSGLSAVETLPFEISTEKVFEIFTGKELDGSYQIINNTTPDGLDKSSLVLKGEKPFYDLELNVATQNAVTEISYRHRRYNYIDTVFYINENRDSLTKEELSFETKQNATEKVSDLLSQFGAQAVNLECYALSEDTLQRLYDERKKEGTLRDNRYGTGDSTVKNESAVAEKAVWEASDACYYIEGNISLQGVSVFGGDITAIIDSEGVAYFSVNGLVSVESKSEKSEVLTKEEIISRLDVISRNIYSEDGVTLTDLKLCFYPVEKSVYKPLWIANLSYTFTNPDGVKEEREAEILLDATNGEEVVFGG